MFQVRQGDIYIRSINAIPAEAKPVAPVGGRAVLAYGEATGHAHAITKDQAQLFAANDNLFLRVVEGGATLFHEEHDRINIPAGDYQVIRQREYDDIEEFRMVVD